MNYGIPYKGSKNRIAKKIIDILPTAPILYDLFAGGCAITHCALLENKYQKIIANDIEGGAVNLFLDALKGKFKNRYEWISREDYFNNIEDPFVRYVWSFGNKGNCYVYGRHIEQLKKALHYAVVFNDFSLLSEPLSNLVKTALNGITDIKERRLACRRAINTKNGLERLIHIERLDRLQSLESPQSSLSIKTSDYRDINTSEKGIIYCDIPYKNTNRYGKKCSDNFDYDAFYTWAENQTNPVYISEYAMPEDRFICIAEFEKASKLCAKVSKKTIEKVFRPIKQLEKGL